MSSVAEKQALLDKLEEQELVDLRRDVQTNKVYRPFYKDKKRYNIFYGGAGSGKSVFVAQRIVRRLLDEPGHNFLILRKFAVTNRLSTFPLIKQILSGWNVLDQFTINKTELTITHIKSGNQIVFSGLDDPEKLKSITFANGPLTDVWIEEATETSESDVTAVDLRLRGSSPHPFQLTLTFNPISAFHWIKRKFLDTPSEDLSWIKTTYKDNRFLDEAYIKMLDGLQGTAGVVYRDGNWGLLEGLIFNNFDVQELPENAKLKGYGLDFGFSSDPAALVAVYETDDKNIWLRELVYKTGLTNQDLIVQMHANGVSPLSEIIADSAEPKSIEDIFRAGFNIHPAVKGPDSVRNGIDRMQALKIHITPDSPNIQKEFYAYSWKKNKEGRDLPVPVDAFNHGIDATRYFITRKQAPDFAFAFG